MCQFQPGDSVQVTAGVCGTVIRRETLGGRINLIVRLQSGDEFTLACAVAVPCPTPLRATAKRARKTPARKAKSAKKAKKKKPAKRASRTRRA